MCVFIKIYHNVGATKSKHCVCSEHVACHNESANYWLSNNGETVLLFI